MLLNTSTKQLIYFIFFALTGICASIFICIPAYAACEYERILDVQMQNSDIQMQIIITYDEAPINYKDPDFLLGLSTKIEAKIKYLNSVSSNTHTYIVTIPKNKNPDDIIKNIKNLQNVKRVELDRLIQHL